MPEDKPPLHPGEWRPLRDLLDAMDDQIAELYLRYGVDFVRPRFVKFLLLLSRHGAQSIRGLAELAEATHSATSQSVSVMRSQGLVDSEPGADARTRMISLTSKASRVIPLLEAEWAATEQAVRQLDLEVPYAMTKVVADLSKALATRSFADRIQSVMPTIELGPPA